LLPGRKTLLTLSPYEVVKMSQVDMSAKAVTARLKLVSDLRDLCLFLGKAKIEKQPAHRQTRQYLRKPGGKRKSK
jgi:hypothetical protein